MKARYQKYLLNFKRPSGTSRGVLTEKETWFIIIEHQGKTGIGECGILRTLSYDDRPDYQAKLEWVCQNIDAGPEQIWEELRDFPSIQFGVEMAFKSLEAAHPFILTPSDFTAGFDAIPINGLVWMGSREYMKEQIIEKIASGFTCIKLKIGAIDFDTELELLRFIRSEFSARDIEIRVDANGAFGPSEALDKLNQLSEFSLHSIEQPIRQGQPEEMARLCEKTPLPIALDEELIGVTDVTLKEKLLLTIRPQYIIFKPSLIGGYTGTQEWLRLADDLQIGWWMTSALESNVGLNAIAQFTYGLEPKMPQGLGTGSLYTNNIKAPLEVANGKLHYHPTGAWKFNL